ncbi:hypothetical protein LINGRAHAP2_LOCUS20321 [Linum grandiflorum]
MRWFVDDNGIPHKTASSVINQNPNPQLHAQRMQLKSTPSTKLPASELPAVDSQIITKAINYTTLPYQKQPKVMPK